MKIQDPAIMIHCHPEYKALLSRLTIIRQPLFAQESLWKIFQDLGNTTLTTHLARSKSALLIRNQARAEIGFPHLRERYLTLPRANTSLDQASIKLQVSLDTTWTPQPSGGKTWIPLPSLTPTIGPSPPSRVNHAQQDQSTANIIFSQTMWAFSPQ